MAYKYYICIVFVKYWEYVFMMCERCQSDEVVTYRTTKQDDITKREYVCQNCDLHFYTEERKTAIRHFSNTLRKVYQVGIEKYRREKLWDSANNG